MNTVLETALTAIVTGIAFLLLIVLIGAVYLIGVSIYDDIRERLE